MKDREDCEIIHNLTGTNFEGNNFLGKLHDIKCQIQLILLIQGKIQLEHDIIRRLLTVFNAERWINEIPVKNPEMAYEKLQRLHEQLPQCDWYIFEISSLKKYLYRGFPCQFEQAYGRNLSEFDIQIQTAEELYSDLTYLVSLLPEKKILFQCHFRPNIIYDNEIKCIEKREIIFHTLEKFCKERDNIFLHDPSILIKNDHSLFDGNDSGDHFTPKGLEENGKYIYEHFLQKKNQNDL
jgi:hypothetical protein